MKTSSRKIAAGLLTSLMLLTMIEPLQAAKQEFVTFKETEGVVSEQPEEKESKVKEEKSKEKYTPEIPISRKSFSMPSTKAITTEQKWFTFSGNTITGYSASLDAPKDIVIPNTYEKDGNTYQITEIANNVFAGMQLQSIVLNDNLITIGNQAFLNNSEIVDLIIPNSVTSIGSAAFKGCTGLTNVTLSTELTTLPSELFSDTNVAKIVIPSKVTQIGQKAFYQCKNLSLVTFASANTLTKIDTSAFYYCESLTSISLPDSLTSINNSAFAYCKGLKNITIPSKLTTLSASVFSNCESLTTLVIPDNIKQIYERAFAACNKLKEISIGSGTTYIYYNAFSSIATKAKIRFKTQKVNTISSAPWGATGADVYWYATDNSCFYIEDDGTVTGFKPLDHDSTPEHNASLTHTIVNIPEKIGDTTVTAIGEEAFYSNNTITSVTLPSTLKSIGTYAFALNTKITKITLPDALETIGANAFFASSALAEIVIGKGIKTIGTGAFNATKNGVKIHLEDYEVNSIAGSPWGAENAQIYWKSEDDSCFYTDGAGKILGFKPLDHGTSAEHSLSLNHTKANIPSSINGITISSIGKEAFKGSPLTEVTIPSTVTTIDDYAFSESSLKEITIPSTVTDMGIYVFSSCKSLVTVTLPDNMTEISQYSFDQCKSLERVNLPNNLKVIDVNAFAFSGLKEITIPSQVEFIGDRAFINTQLTSVTIPAKVKTVGRDAFYNTSTLQKVEIKNGSTNYDEQTFANCKSLVDVNLPKEMTSIPASMFSGCSSLKSVVLPANLKTIDTKAFYNSGITEIFIPEGVTTIGDSAFSTTSLTSIILPDSVKTLGSNAFENCKKLVSAKLSDNLTALKSAIFKNNLLLESVIIPSSVTTISNDVFNGCSNLQNIALPSALKSLGSGAFNGCASLNELNLPKGLTQIGDNAINGTNISEITLPSTLTSITVKSLVGFKGNEIYVEQRRDGSSISKTQPWGAATGTTVYYKGEFTSITDSVTYASNFGKGVIKLEVEAPDNGIIKIITLPDGTEIVNVDKATHMLEYEFSSNDEFTFTASSNSGHVTTHIVQIDKIEYATIEATGFSLTLDEVSSLTETSIISKAKATATKNYDNSSLAVKLTTPLADIKSALNKNGSNTIVTLSAQTTIPGTATTVTVEKKITLYVLKEYTVTFNNWDGSLLKTDTVFEGADAIAPSTNPKRLGYTFTGWDKSLTNIRINTVFTAQYDIRNYTIHYNTNGGTPSIADKSVTYSQAGLIPNTTVSKNHYTMKGWAKSGGNIISASTPYSDLVSSDSITSLTLYAQWDPITYHLSFNANGGTGSKDSIDFDADHTRINTGSNTMKKVGHTFEGWNTKADGSGTSIASNSSYTPPLQDTVLYAQWTEQKASYYIAVPATMELKEDSSDSRYVSSEGTIKIIDENAENGTMRDAPIEIYCDPFVELTSPKTSDSYKALVYDDNGNSYTNNNNPLMILGINSTKEKNFTLKAVKNKLFHRGEYQGSLNFTIKFGGG